MSLTSSSRARARALSSTLVAAIGLVALAPAATADQPAARRPPTPPPADQGARFDGEVRQLFREVACGGTEPIADKARAKVVDAHCKRIAGYYKKYRERYEKVAKPWFDATVPASAPRVIVYPFGGGDLISALTAFPDADEITTISLELSGDPRRIGGLGAKALSASLGDLRTALGGTLTVGSNTSVNLSSSQRIELPAQVSSFLLGLAFNGYEPVGMRFFKLEDDGAIHYYASEEIAAMDAALAEKAAARGRGKRATAASRKGSWLDPNFTEAFANVEIAFRKQGDAGGRVRVHRHLGWNLANDSLAKAPQLLRHLERKGKVTFLVKGASYLLWEGGFSTFRDYMLAHLAWMLSDSTGIPPRHVTAAGMVQDTYGNFSGPFLEGAGARQKRDADDFRALWKKNPRRKLGFRFGYVDAGGSGHLVVTRPGP
jgi:hypothetical protein